MNLRDALIETIEIAVFEGNGNGVRGVKAYRLLDWAVHEIPFHKGNWSITHLPTGMSLKNIGGVFKDAEPAWEAMIEISRLKNDWHLYRPDDEDAIRIRDQVSKILKDRGGVASYHGRYEKTVPIINGYNNLEVQ